MIPSHIDTDDVRSFLSFWHKVGAHQPRIYPDYEWFQISVTMQQAELAGRPPLKAAEIADSLGLPAATVAERLAEMEDSRHVRREAQGWVPDEGAWFALELFLPTFKQMLADAQSPTAE